MDIQEIRKFLIDQPFKIADDLDEVLSINIVGSFAEANDLSGISDIDTVIIIDHLTEWKFNEIISKFESIGDTLKSKYGLDLYINSTFGPLKYNKPNSVVYHVMVYDVARHIIHCRKSPFTCYDWQRTNLYSKSHISDIYKVQKLMPHHFFNARRGVKEYLSDYEKSVVSYRSYRFVDGEVIEERHEKQMSVKDRFEFAYHIIRFIMANFTKMYESENIKYSNESLCNKFINIFPSFGNTLPKYFEKISNYKTANKFPDEVGDLDIFIRSFLNQFEDEFHRIFSDDSNNIYFCRHEKTELNKGTLFLGQKLDPEVKVTGTKDINLKIDKVFTSPSLRAKQTAAFLTDNIKPQICIELSEIDYGAVEGKDFDWLCQRYPEILAAWGKGQDPAFPDGESQADVLARVKNFVSNNHFSGTNTLVVTHNVWLRCLIGHYLGIEIKDWYKINITHCFKLKFRCVSEEKIVPDLSAEDIQLLLRNIEIEDFKKNQALRDDDLEERVEFWSSISRDEELLSKKNHEVYDGTLLVPMAGEGSRYRDVGFETTKPLIKVDSCEMITKVVHCLPYFRHSIFLVRDTVLSDEVSNILSNVSESTDIVPVYELTEGQACTCLLGIDNAPVDKPLLIAPCDNGMIWKDENYKSLLSDPEVDVICWTFTKHLSIKAKPEAWGYVEVDEFNNALSVSVKKPITAEPYNEHCIIGTFWFKTASLFKDLAHELISRNMRVNNEFYVDSMIGLAIDLGKKVKIFDVDRYISWGKPEDLFEYRKWKELVELYSL